MLSTESNKAKIAKRVIEVLEFFDDDHPRATVMDIVRRFNRPQSSTSDLLSSLVDLGLLYKDPYSRSYTPTPRAAMLGCAGQSEIVRDGRLTGLMDRLHTQTDLAVAVFGMVGLNVQIFNWRAGARTLRTAGSTGLFRGLQEQLSESAAGWLLLSTVDQPRRDGMIRRLNAEAAPERKFSVPTMAASVQQCRELGYASGAVGFGASAAVTAILLPGQPHNQPLALGFVYEPSDHVDEATLRHSLADAAYRCAHANAVISSGAQPMHHAA